MSKASQKKQTVTDSEPKGSSASNVNVQETMDHLCKKEVEDVPSNDVKQQAQEQNHNFWFHFKNKTQKVEVRCNASMTVIKALMESTVFKNEREKKKCKEIIIERSKGKVPGAAVKTDFPCCLIEQGDNLEITFINNAGKASTGQLPPADLSLSRTNLVTFYIKTTGGKNVKYVMKNNHLSNTADYVCVYALKGVEVKTALKRDGRFADKIFDEKICVLSESESQPEL